VSIIGFIRKRYHAWVFRKAMRDLDARIEARKRRHARHSDLIAAKRERVHALLRGSK